MKHTGFLLGCMTIGILVESLCTTPLLLAATLNGTFSLETTPVVIGRLQLQDTIQGIPLDILPDAPHMKNVHAVPFSNTCILQDLTNVLLFENVSSENLTSLNDFYQIINDTNVTVTPFSDVTITTSNGFFAFGMMNGNLRIDEEIPFAISTIAPVDFGSDLSIPFFFSLSSTILPFHYTGDFSVLSQISSQGKIQINDGLKKTLWTGNFSHDLLVISDSDFTLVQQPPLCMLPLNTDPSGTAFNLTLSPSDSSTTLPPSFHDLIDFTDLQGNLSKISTPLQNISTIIPSSLTIFNGGVLLFDTNDTISVDRTDQTFKSNGFLRGTHCTISVPASTSSMLTLQGTCQLIFLGNHFYNTEAKDSKNGITFPLLLLVIWSIAIVLFLLLRFIVTPPIRKINQPIKRSAYVFHIVAHRDCFCFNGLANKFSIWHKCTQCNPTIGFFPFFYPLSFD